MYLGVDWSDAEGDRPSLKVSKSFAETKSVGNEFQIFTNAGKKLYL